MKNKTLKNLFENGIDDSIEDVDNIQSEATGTGAVGGYSTPYAFSKRSLKDRAKRAAEESGYEVADTSDKRWQIKFEGRSDIKEGRTRYLNFKESEYYKKPGAKISFCIREIKKMIREINFLTDISSRFKLENEITPELYWKRSVEDLSEVDSLLKELRKKLIRLKK